jgi:hypothetical protein
MAGEDTFNSLKSLEAYGAVNVEIACLGKLTDEHGRTQWCGHRVVRGLDMMIKRFGPEATLTDIARAAGPCRFCGARGAYVQWSPPPGTAAPGYWEYVFKRRENLISELLRIEERMREHDKSLLK